MRTIVGIGAIVLGLVFAVAAVSKLFAPRDEQTSDVVRLILPWVPSASVQYVRAAILVTEFLLASLLIVGVGRPLALSGAVVLLSVFLCVLLVLGAIHGFDSRCNCFGTNAASSKVSFGIWRNLVLTALAVILLTFESNGVNGESLSDMGATDLLWVATACGFLAVMHRLASNRLVRSQRPDNDVGTGIRRSSRN